MLAISTACHVIFASFLCTGSTTGNLDFWVWRRWSNGWPWLYIQRFVNTIWVGLNIPPFLGKKYQLDGIVVVETRQIISLQIHAEWVIRRAKEFNILTGVISATLAGSASQIWTICCCLQNPLISCFKYHLHAMMSLFTSFICACIVHACFRWNRISVNLGSMSFEQSSLNCHLLYL